MGTVARDGVNLPVGIQFMTEKRTDATLFAIAKDVLNEA
jgi:Asp-tRNA(Asn)/Glu-tRNA(Gln) amidotransferase A subunit family amidase